MANKEVRGFVLCCIGGKYLVLGKTKKSGFVWQLPGGRSEEKDGNIGALPVDVAKRAALRELHEETGIHMDEDLIVLMHQRGPKYLFGTVVPDNLLPESCNNNGTRVNCEGVSLYLTEHETFSFVSSLSVVIEMVQDHSGGFCSDVLRDSFHDL